MYDTKRPLHSHYSGPLAERIKKWEQKIDRELATHYPAWTVGDHVRHRSNGIRGILVEMMTQAGELWKMRPHRSRGLLTVHARDLVRDMTADAP